MICLLKVKYVNAAIDSAVPGSQLYGLEHIKDPSDKIIEVHIAALNLSLKWNILQRPFGLWRVRLYDTYDIIHTDP